MVRTRLLAAAAALALGLPAVGASAANDKVPQLDVEPSCLAAEAAALVVGRTGDNCRNDEKNARDALAREWDSFSVADRGHCRSLIRTGGPPSYVELLSCLEVSRDARKIAEERTQRARTGSQGSETTGVGPTSTPVTR
jgi:hypothetical protein